MPESSLNEECFEHISSAESPQKETEMKRERKVEAASTETAPTTRRKPEA
jgi:hypothetical protein